MLRLLRDPSLNAKAWYLWCFASYVAVGPFLNVYFEHRGLSRAQVGLIGALRPWISAPASFAWAAAADRLAAHRAVLLATFAGSVGVRLLLLLPPLRFGGLLAVVLAAEVLGAPAGVLADAAVMTRICEKESDYGKYRLWGAVGWGGFSTIAGWLISHLGIRWAFYTQAILAVPSLIHGARFFEAHTRAQPAAAAAGGASAAGRGHEHGSGDDDDDDNIGGHDDDGDRDMEEAEPLLPVSRGANTADSRQRPLERLSHRSAGAAAAAAVAVAADEAAAAGPAGGSAVTGTQANGEARPVGGGRAGGGSGSGGCAAEEGGGHGTAGRGGHWRRLGALLRRWEVLLFFAITTVMGYGFGTIDSFLFLYLEEMGASGTLMGLTLTITCAAEVPAFHLQDRLLDAWGVSAVLDLVVAVYALRLALYAALPAAGNVMWVLPIEVLHGITFACGWGAGTVNCKLLAPPELAATLQGAFQGLYFGAGYGLGSLVGGWVGSKLGWQGMFACASATMLAFWIATMVARRVLAALVSSQQAASARGKSVELSPAAHALPDPGTRGF